ncbi:hypothetical protein ACFL54_05945 [Planctomycetota bacterium]
MRIRILSAFILILMSIPTGNANADYIVLKNGRHVTGEIVGYDRTGFSFVSRDSRKPKHIRWSSIDPQCAQKLRRQLNVAAIAEQTEEEEYTEDVIALYLHLTNGGCIMGVKVDESEDHYTLTRRGMLFSVNKEMIAWQVEKSVDPLSVYTREELAKKRMEEFRPETAIDFKAYGDYCKDMKTYEEAVKAYRKAIELNPGFTSGLEPVIDLLNSILRDDKIRKEYTRIRCRAFLQHNYREAEVMLADLRIKYPDKSELADKIRQDIETDKKTWQLNQMAYWYFRHFYSECKRVAVQTGRLEDAMAELPAIKEKVEAFVIRKLNLDQSEFNQLWQNRNKDGNWVMLRMASYGSGTFMAEAQHAQSGENIQKDIKPGRSIEGPIRIKGGGKSNSGKGALPDKWSRGHKIRRPGEVATLQEWWAERPVLARHSFVKAKYAEKYLKIHRYINLPCTNCGGTGRRMWIRFGIGSGPGMGYHTCTVCHGLKIYKEIRFH